MKKGPGLGAPASPVPPMPGQEASGEAASGQEASRPQTARWWERCEELAEEEPEAEEDQQEEEEGEHVRGEASGPHACEEEEEQEQEEEEEEQQEQEEEGPAPLSDALLWTAHCLAEHQRWDELEQMLAAPCFAAVVSQVAAQERPSGWSPPAGVVEDAARAFKPAPGWLLLNVLAFRNKAPSRLCKIAVGVARRTGRLNQRNEPRAGKDLEGQTALHCAAAGGNVAMAEALLEAGAGGGTGNGRFCSNIEGALAASP